MEKNQNKVEKIEEKVKHDVKRVGDYAFSFLKWLFISGITGIACGLVGSAFRFCVDYVTGIREANSFLIYLLPVGGLVIAFLYRVTKLNGVGDTNMIINSVRTDEKIPIYLAPIVFISTIITQLFGGSAGREGAALQLGGAIGAQIARWFKLEVKDIHIAIMVGMSGFFSALFGTPLTATIFAMEVISVGIFYYSAFIPCMVSSLIGYGITNIFNLNENHIGQVVFPNLDIISILQVACVGICCALVSIVFCMSLKYVHKFALKYLNNEYIRLAVGGLGVVLLTLIFGTRYNGTGMDIIAVAVRGQDVYWYDFLLKILFTVVTISFGYKGGEIIPTFFIGATLGSFIASFIGLSPAVGAAIGLVALFCGVVNCPIASIVLSVELFGSKGLILFAVSICISYMLSGYFSLYKGQKIMYSKRRALYINKNAK